MPRLISDRFWDPATGLVHRGEPNARDARSEWPWMACGIAPFAVATKLSLTCMACAAGVWWTPRPIP